MKNEVDIKTLSDREHILLRPQMYISSVTEQDYTRFVLEDDKFVLKKVKYAQGLLKIIDEAIDNSVDEGLKTDFKFSNKIDIKIDNSRITIKDNGRGIPVKKNEDGDWIPVIAVCRARTGSNFNDDEDVGGIGKHGLGIKATNIFSSYFKCNTCDGKKRIIIECTNNLEDEYHKFSQEDTNKPGTEITFMPDLKRFGLTEISDTIISLVKLRLMILSYSFEKIKFTFNGEKIRLKTKEDIMSLFSENSICYSNKNWFIGIYPTEEFSFFTYANGISLTRGGSHIDYLSTQISYGVRELLCKKYKALKPADVRNKFGLVVFFKNFPNIQFDSQTKETLTNSYADIKAYLGSDFDLDKIYKDFSKSEFLTDPVLELFKIKEEFKKRQELKKISSTSKKRIDTDKYYPPVGKMKYLMLTEGYSAFSGISALIGRKDIAYFCLRGKPLNICDCATKDLISNQEFKELVDILNIDLLNKETDMSFEKVVFLSDADCYNGDLLVHTKLGLKEMKNISYEDEILTEDFEYEKPIKLIEKNTNEVIYVETETGHLCLSPTQKINIIRNNNRIEILAEELIESDELIDIN